MNEERVEVTWQEVMTLPENTYQLVDIRDKIVTAYGMIPGASHISEDELEDVHEELPTDKKIILYCTRGNSSREMAERLREYRDDVYSLAEGYRGWLLVHNGQKMEEEKTEEWTAQREKDSEISKKAADVEKSLQKRFHSKLFSKFARAVSEYELVKENDKIAVCISGGKDSMLMAKLFQELKKHNKFPFELVFLVMDPGYSPENRNIIEKNAEMLSLPITIFETNIFEAVYHVEKSPCYLCARMRRGYLYREAQRLGCNKIALGHHYDDVIETILMGMLYGAQVQTMMPKLCSTNVRGMELIRPMYLIREEDIKRWRDYNHLHFIQCACRFTDTCTSCGPDHTGSKRQEIKRLIQEMKKQNPQIESNIFHSVENVNLKTIIGYKDETGNHSFLECYGADS